MRGPDEVEVVLAGVGGGKFDAQSAAAVVGNPLFKGIGQNARFHVCTYGAVALRKGVRNAGNLAVVQVFQALQRPVGIGPGVDGGEHVVIRGALRLGVGRVQPQLAVFFLFPLGEVVAAGLPQHERRELAALRGQEGRLQLVGYDNDGFNIFVHAFFYLYSHCVSRRESLFSSSQLRFLY